MTAAARAPGVPPGRCSRSKAAAALAGLLLGGCAAHQALLVSSGTPVAGAAPDVVWLEQGWSEESLDLFAWGGLGAAFVPYDWFLVLDQPDGSLFRSAGSMDRFGFLVDQPTASNPDGLPIGLGRSVDRETGEASLGLTCAACHLGQISYGKQAVRVAGGQALTNVPAMLGALYASIDGVVGDEARLERMARALPAPKGRAVEPEALAGSLRAWLDERRPTMEVNVSPLPTGPGRTDALGRLLNVVLSVASGLEGAAQPLVAPVSTPAVWNAHRLNANLAGAEWGTRGEGTLALGVAQVLGLSPRLELPGIGPAAAGYPSSVDVAALGDLESRLQRLRPPAWPAMLPPIDGAEAERGAVVYEQFCLRCHPVLDPADPEAVVDVLRVPLEAIGTDDSAAQHLASRRVATGPYAGRPSDLRSGPALGAEEPALVLLQHVVAGVLTHQGGVARKAIARSTAPQVGAPLPSEPVGYMARPLHGVWATAPYLHNGSVPSLYALLLPPEERPEGFHLGDGRFDPVDVGYAQDAGPGQSRLDTTLSGNSNAGHLYGTGLRNARRRELIEYLKTL